MLIYNFYTGMLCLKSVVLNIDKYSHSDYNNNDEVILAGGMHWHGVFLFYRKLCQNLEVYLWQTRTRII